MTSCATPTGSFSIFAVDVTTGNESNRVTETITPGNCAPPADLVITKTASPDPVASGSTLTYTLNVQNIGGLPAGNVTVTDNLPAGLTNVQCSRACSAAGNIITVQLGTFAAGTQVSFMITAMAPSVTVPTSITNTAVVSTTSPESSTANNQASASTTVNPSVTTTPRFIQITDTTPATETLAVPAISSDGSTVAFVQQEGEGLGHLFVARPAGTAPTQVPLNGLFVSRSYGVAIGGNRILFVGCNTSADCSFGNEAFLGNLYVVNIDGADLRPLTTGGAHLPLLIPPVISADGTKVAYVTSSAWQTGGGPVTVIDIGATNTTTRPVDLPSIARYTSPRLSGNGSSVAFLSQVRPGTYDLNVLPADGTTIAVLTDVGPPATEFDFQFSAAGNTVAYASRIYGFASTFGLFAAHTDGTAPTLLEPPHPGFQPADAHTPSLTSDGMTVAYLLGITNSLVLVHADGTNRQPIIEFPGGVDPIGRQLFMFAPAISGNGRAIVLVSNADLDPGKNVDGSAEVFLVILPQP